MSHTRYASVTVDLGPYRPGYRAELIGRTVAKTVEALFPGDHEAEDFDEVELTVRFRLDDFTPRLIVTTFKEN